MRSSRRAHGAPVLPDRGTGDSDPVLVHDAVALDGERGEWDAVWTVRVEGAVVVGLAVGEHAGFAHYVGEDFAVIEGGDPDVGRHGVVGGDAGRAGACHGHGADDGLWCRCECGGGEESWEQDGAWNHFGRGLVTFRCCVVGGCRVLGWSLRDSLGNAFLGYTVQGVCD